MSDAPAAPREIETRLRPALNVLWGGGATTTPSAEAGFLALAQAARHASELWPDHYFGEGVLRLVYDPAEPPAAEILAAAGRAGLDPAPYASTDEARAAACDIAAVGRGFDDRIPPELPRLTLASEGARLLLPPSFALPTRAFGAPPQAREERAAGPTEIAEATLAPPRGSRERAQLGAYLAEDLHARPLRFEYQLLLLLVGERSTTAADKDDSWSRAANFADADHSVGLAALRREYERADALALAYGRRWRSKLAARSFLLFAANLSSGLIGALFSELSVYTLAFQTVAIALTYVDQFVSKRGQWRLKWLDYRGLAEAARIARFCSLGGAPVPAATPPTWIDWRVSRALRAATAPTTVTDARAPAFMTYLRDVEIDRQIDYHAAAHLRFRRMDTRLSRAAAAALVGTFVLGGGFALGAVSGSTRVSVRLMDAVGLAVSAGPGLYVALNTLRLQLDVARQAERSKRLGVALHGLRRAIAAAPPSSALARAAAFRAAEIMHEDVLNWDRVMQVV